MEPARGPCSPLEPLPTRTPVHTVTCMHKTTRQQSSTRSSRRRLFGLLAVLGILAAPAVTSAADPTVPGQVEITEIVPGNGRITLHWAINGPGGTPTTLSYVIAGEDEDADSITDEAIFAAASVASPLVITTNANGNPLKAGVSYVVILFATNGNGDGPDSPAVTVTVGATRLAPPRITAVTPGDQFLKVDFAQDLPGLDFVQYSTDNGVTWSEQTAITSASTSISISTLSSDSGQALTNGTRYTLRLRGWDTGGRGTTGMSAAAVGIPSTVPSSPEVTSVEPRGNSIVVNAELGLTGGSPITRLEYSTDNGANWSVVLPMPAALLAPVVGPPAQPNKLNVPGSAFTFTITTESGTATRIAAGKSYTVVMRAANLLGLSGDSNAAGADTIGANELSPSVIDSILARGSMLIVRGTLPTLQSGVSILRVEYSTDNGTTWRSTGQKSASFSITSASTSASTAITAGGEYQVRTRIVTTAGTSPASSAYPVRAGSVPAPPAITSASVGVDGLKIVGTLGADNGAPIVRVEYSTDNGASWFTAPISSGSTGGSTGGTTTTPSSSTTVPSSSTTVPSSSTTLAPVTSTTAPALATSIQRNLDFTVTAVSANGRDPIALGVRYVVRVRAVSAVGVGAPSAAKVASAARTASAPTIKEVKAVIGSFAVEAILGATNGASVTDVEYSTDNGATWLSTSQITGNFTITSPSNDENSPLMSSRFYEIRVRVVTANGVGAASIPVTKKAIAKVQRITFPQPAGIFVDAAPFVVNASANSKLPVTVTSSTPKVCTTVNSVMGAAKARVTILAPGTCTLTATRGPSGTYPAAGPVTRSFTVRTKPELAAGSPVNFRDAVSLTGRTAGVKVQIRVKSMTPQICGVVKRAIVAKAAGTCKVRVTVKPAKGKATTKPLTFVIAG
jgi:hypothetical protein